MRFVTKVRQFLRWEQLPLSLQTFAQLSLVLSLLSWAAVIFARLLHLHDPYRATYFYPQFADDLVNYRDRFALFGHTGFYTAPGQAFLYPATLAVVYHLLFVAWGNLQHPQAIIAIVALAVSVSALVLFYRALCKCGLANLPAALFCAITFFTSYPLAYEIQRGNVEIIVWLTMLLAFWAFRKDSFYLAAVFIGIAIAFKFYPVILLALFLHRKRYRAIPVALVVAVLLTLLSDLWLGPSIKIAQAESSHGMQGFMQIYVLHFVGVGYDHSLLALYKTLRPVTPFPLKRDVRLYFVLIAVAASALYLFRIRIAPMINQICILVLLSILIPPVSFDYTLLHVYTCWGIFTLYVLDNNRRGILVPKTRQVMIWFAITVAPYNYVFYRHQAYAGFVHCIGMIGLIYLFVKHPFPESKPTSTGTSSSTPAFADNGIH